jgi:hypothetical protein
MMGPIHRFVRVTRGQSDRNSNRTFRDNLVNTAFGTWFVFNTSDNSDWRYVFPASTGD